MGAIQTAVSMLKPPNGHISVKNDVAVITSMAYHKIVICRCYSMVLRHNGNQKIVWQRVALQRTRPRPLHGIYASSLILFYTDSF